MEVNYDRVGQQEAVIESVIAILDQGEALLQELEDQAYTEKHLLAFNASIGGHYRHCLDHFRSLFNSAESGDLNYDHRERGTLIEQDRFAALNATRELKEAYQGLPGSCLDRSLKVTCKTSYSLGGSQTSTSSVGREVMYAVAHAVHHHALIGIMAGLMGIKLPDGFGIAPSTLKHRAVARAIAKGSLGERISN